MRQLVSCSQMLRAPNTDAVHEGRLSLVLQGSERTSTSNWELSQGVRRVAEPLTDDRAAP
jgi:hypothetical protein